MPKKLAPLEVRQAAYKKIEETKEKLKIVEKELYIPYWHSLSIENFENEVWKDIKGYEGRYQISNLGRLKSLHPTRSVNNTPKILKQQRNNFGYRFVNFSSPIKKGLIHRMLAEIFIPNPDNLAEVNHINGNPEDCRLINLEWGSKSHNTLHRYRIMGKKQISMKKGIEHPQSMKIFQKDKDNNIIKIWDSQGDIERALGYKQSCISRCCTGKCKKGFSYGFKWEFYNENQIINNG